jgi:hypothetical protein
MPTEPDPGLPPSWLKRSETRERRYWFAASLFVVLAPALSSAEELRPETLAAWDHYIEQAKFRANSRLDPRQHFLWVDESPDRARRVRTGEILVAPMKGSGRIEVPYGLIHDWIGAAFLSDTTIENIFATMDQYACYKEFYKPMVIDSKLLSRTGNEITFSMRWLKKVLWVTTVSDAEYKACYFRRDEKSRYGFVESTRIQDVVNYGRPSERNLPAGTGSGFMWRLFSISRFEELDGGVYVELEAMALSRRVPAYLTWAVNPLVSQLSQSSLVTSLSQTRDAVRPRPQRTGQDSCGSKAGTWTAHSSELRPK